MAKVKNIFFDVETNGFKYIRKHGHRHNIIQIGAVDEFGNSFNEMVKPRYPIHELSTRCHGFTDKDVENADNFKTVWNKFLNTIVFLNGDGELDFDQQVCLIAHNCYGFDMYVLLEECSRFDITFEKNIAFFDTLDWFKRNIHIEYTPEDPTPYSLGSLYRREFGKDFDNAHDAFADVIALKQLFLRKKIDITMSEIVFNGLDGLTKYLRTSLTSVEKLKGIGRWRNSVICEVMNQHAEYVYKYEGTCPLEDLYDKVFSKFTISEAASFLRDKLKMKRDDYIAEIISVICNVPVTNVFNEINTCNSALLKLNLPAESIELLNNANVVSLNELIELEHFENEHCDEIRAIFDTLNQNPVYIKEKQKF